MTTLAVQATQTVLTVAGSDATLAVTLVRGAVLTAPAEQGPMGVQGPIGPQGPPGGSSNLIAAVTVSGHTGLMFAVDGSGTVLPADPNATPYVFAGVSTAAAQTGASVAAIDVGLIVEPSWAWAPLAPIFVTAGGRLTQAAPTSGVVHLVGFAVTAQSMFVDPQPPIPII